MSQWNLGGLVAGSISGFIAVWIVMRTLVIGEWNLSGLVVGSVLGSIAAWIVTLVSRPRGVEHRLYFPMAVAAIMIGPLLVYLSIDVDAWVAAFSRREIEWVSQLFWFSAGFAHTIACGIAIVASVTVDIVRIVRSRRA